MQATVIMNRWGNAEVTVATSGKDFYAQSDDDFMSLASAGGWSNDTEDFSEYVESARLFVDRMCDEYGTTYIEYPEYIGLDD
jgi:hypothetical protein